MAFNRLFSCFGKSSSAARLTHTPSTVRLLPSYTPDRLISHKASSSTTARLLKHTSNRSFSGASSSYTATLPKFKFTLRDFKHDPLYYVRNFKVDPKKYFAVDVIEEICENIKSGIPGGSLALDDITVIHARARLPKVTNYDPNMHKNYIEGYKDFFYELYGGYEPVDDTKYIDVKSYVKALETVDQLYLLRLHPFFQLDDEAMRFIPFAVQVLENVKDKFPDPKSMHQPRFEIYKGNWRDIYSFLREQRPKVNISGSINSLASQDHKVIFRSIYDAGKSEKSETSGKSVRVPYEDTDAFDELVFLLKLCSLQPHTYQSSIKFRNADDKFQALSQPSQIVSLTLYELLWKYAGHHNGPIDMDIFRQSDPI